MVPAIIVLISFLLRIAFLSPWLEDWDSVQFALGIHDFDITKQQPHAPGYILYVLVAKFFYLFTTNDTLALTLISTVSGALAIFFIFFIAKKMFNERVALLASILFAVTPISWMMSISPLTNMSGLLSFLFFAYFLYVNGKKRLPLAAGIGGLILGVRATELPIVLSLLALAFFRNPSKKRLLSSILYFLVGIAIWLIPTILSKGLNAFLLSYKWIASYVLTHDSIINQGLFSRIQRILWLLSVSYTLLFVVFGVVSFIFIILGKKNLKNYKFQFLLVWLLSYLVPLIFVYNLEVPRYTLPLLPPMVMATSYLISHIMKKNNLLAGGIYLVLSISLFRQGWRQVNLASSLTPPTVAAAFFVKQNFSPEETTIVSSFAFRHFQYYAPQFKNYWGLEKLPAIPKTRYVITDYKGFVGQSALKEYNLYGEKTFEGPAEIFPRVSKINLYTLKRK